MFSTWLTSAAATWSIMGTSSREMTIQTRGEMKSAAEFNRLVIARQGDRLVRLQDIGLARDGVQDERARARQPPALQPGPRVQGWPVRTG